MTKEYRRPIQDAIGISILRPEDMVDSKNDGATALVVVPAGPTSKLSMPNLKMNAIYTRPEFINGKMLKNISPKVIFSSLHSGQMDVIDLSSRLFRLGWTGDLICFSSPLEKTRLVAPGLFTINPLINVCIIEAN